jgi:hypothetical protein
MAVWWHCPELSMSVPSLAGEAREQIRAVSTIVGRNGFHGIVESFVLDELAKPGFG